MSKRNIVSVFDENPNLFTQDEAALNKLEVKIKLSKVQRKSPYLTEELLLSEEGMSTVYRDFHTQCKFYGKGYERQDLKRLMTAYKVWAFMLNPGSAFPDFLQSCEKLGSKPNVKLKMEQLRQVERERYLKSIEGVVSRPKKTVRFDAASSSCIIENIPKI